MKPVGIFGGAFDPPHLEHMQIAEKAIEEGHVGRVLLMPSKAAPHKCIDASFEDRMQMLRFALAEEDSRIGVSDFELQNGDVSYTATLLPILKKSFGDFYFIIGGDSLFEMHLWYDYENVLKNASFLVVARDGARVALATLQEKYQKQYGTEIVLMDYLPAGISSSEIKLSLRLAEPITGVLSEPVARYIEKEGLYREFEAERLRLQQAIPQETYAHSLRTVRCALKINDRHKLKLNYRTVFLSALLHDCAKGSTGEGEPIPEDAKFTPVAHAFAGAVVAARDYGIADPEILDAICYHTTARPQMSTLEKLIYAADVLEAGRDYEGVDTLRGVMQEDFERGFCACLAAGYRKLQERNTTIYPLTLDAVRAYIKE